MSSLVKKDLTIDSREVAEMVGKQHAHLLRDIKTYIEYISTNPDLDSLDFFNESIYLDAKGEERPNYQVAKKGCEFIAHKLTGQKGTLFTATYINRFHEMESALKEQNVLADLSPQLQLLINMELKQRELEAAVSETKEEVQAIRDVIVVNPKAEWRKETNNILTSIGRKIDDYSRPRNEVYEALKERANCRPNVLINNLKKRALENGMAPSKADKLNILDVLENDPRLKEIYVTIVKEMAIKHKVA